MWWSITPSGVRVSAPRVSQPGNGRTTQASVGEHISEPDGPHALTMIHGEPMFPRFAVPDTSPCRTNLFTPTFKPV